MDLLTERGIHFNDNSQLFVEQQKLFRRYHSQVLRVRASLRAVRADRESVTISVEP